jgi:hypothetical protein
LKNRRDGIVGVFMREKFWFENILSLSVARRREGVGPSRERGFGGQRPQLEDCSTYVWQKWHCVGVRKVSHGMADGSPRPMTNPPRLYTYLTPRQHTADSVEWRQNTISIHNIKSVALQRRKIYIHTTGPHLGPLPSTACFSTQTCPSFRLAQDIFDLNLSPNNLIPVIIPAYTAHEYGTDSVFRNVGILNSDAGESLKNKNIT